MFVYLRNVCQSEVFILFSVDTLYFFLINTQPKILDFSYFLSHFQCFLSMNSSDPEIKALPQPRALNYLELLHQREELFETALRAARSARDKQWMLAYEADKALFHSRRTATDEDWLSVFELLRKRNKKD